MASLRYPDRFFLMVVKMELPPTGDSILVPSKDRTTLFLKQAFIYKFVDARPVLE